MKLSAHGRSTLAFLPFIFIGGAIFLLLTMTWLLLAGIISAVVISSVLVRRILSRSRRDEAMEGEGSPLIIDNDDPRNEVKEMQRL